MEKLELTIKDRLAILTSLPKEGNFTELMFVRQIEDSIRITAEEMDKYNIKSMKLDNGVSTLVWDRSADTILSEFDFVADHIKFLNGIFTNLSNEHKLTMDHFDAVKKIFDKAKELNLNDDTTN